MADNPYQAPQTRDEVALLPAWRRHLSNVLVILGVLGTFLLALVLVQSVHLMANGTGTAMNPFVLHNPEMLWRVAVSAAVLGLVGPGFILSGLAIRRVLRGHYAGAAVAILLIVLSIYLSWWWPRVPVMQQTIRDVNAQSQS
jgi:hypothetical protein